MEHACPEYSQRHVWGLPRRLYYPSPLSPPSPLHTRAGVAVGRQTGFQGLQAAAHSGSSLGRATSASDTSTSANDFPTLSLYKVLKASGVLGAAARERADSDSASEDEDARLRDEAGLDDDDFLYGDYGITVTRSAASVVALAGGSSSAGAGASDARVGTSGLEGGIGGISISPTAGATGAGAATSSPSAGGDRSTITFGEGAGQGGSSAPAPAAAPAARPAAEDDFDYDAYEAQVLAEAAAAAEAEGR